MGIDHLTWTADLAYVVGLLTTDGNLSLDGRHLEFSSQDVEQVQLFRELLGLNNRITRKPGGISKDKLYSHIQSGNVVFYR